MFQSLMYRIRSREDCIAAYIKEDEGDNAEALKRWSKLMDQMTVRENPFYKSSDEGCVSGEIG